MKIYNAEPQTWKDLEFKVAEVFNDMNCKASVQKSIMTVRGDVNIDVFVEDTLNKPNLIYLCECKYWNSEVPKSVIHAFRTVVNDYGAHCGYIISKMGFQSGAREAAQNSNIFLLNWDEFLTTFEDKWLLTMINKLHSIGEPLRHYCNPLADFFSDVFEQLSLDEQQKFIETSVKYFPICAYSNKMFYLDIDTGALVKEEADALIAQTAEKLKLNDQVFSYKDFFSYMLNKCEKGIATLDGILKQPVRKNRF